MTQLIKKEIVTEKKTDSVREIREFAYSAAIAAGFSGVECRQILLAIETAVTGIILNAQEQGIRGGLAVRIDADETRFRVEINDNGDASRPSPAPGKIRRGLGIFLIKRIMHEVEYEFKRGFTSRLTMVRFRNCR